MSYAGSAPGFACFNFAMVLKLRPGSQRRFDPYVIFMLIVHSYYLFFAVDAWILRMPDDDHDDPPSPDDWMDGWTDRSMNGLRI